MCMALMQAAICLKSCMLKQRLKILTLRYALESKKLDMFDKTRGRDVPVVIYQGDPACDLVIAWTYLSGKAREVFMSKMDLDEDTWLRARAWALWKATFELCQIADKNSPESGLQKRIIDEVMNG